MSADAKAIMQMSNVEMRPFESSSRAYMKLKRTEIQEAVVTRRARKVGLLTSLDVLLSTVEISDLIKQLKLLKREGRIKTGYHIHLWDWHARGLDKFEVGLFHEKAYAKHSSSESIILGDETK